MSITPASAWPLSAGCSRSRGFGWESSRNPTGARPRISSVLERRTCSSALPPATWIRWSTATPRTAASAPTTPTRPAVWRARGRTARSSSTRSACARPSRTSLSSSAASKRACAASRTSTTGRRKCGAPSCSTRALTCWSTATPSARSSRSPIASRSESRSPISWTCAARPSCGRPYPKAGSRSIQPRSTSLARLRHPSIRMRWSPRDLPLPDRCTCGGSGRAAHAAGPKRDA